MADSFDTLVKVLRERDITYDSDEIKAAFENPKSQTAIQTWMQEYLSPETLLTKEEAALYASLVKSGEADKLAAVHDLSAVQGLDDQEILDAIEELKRSTAAIEEQTKTLKMQQVAMSVLVKGNTRSGQTRAQAERNQTRKWNVEKGQISAAVEELIQGLQYQKVDLELQAKGAESNVRQTVEGILRADDKLLQSLQKLASDLDPGSDDDEIIDRIRELCARFIKHTVEGVRTRLDRIYLETLQECKDTTNGQEDSQELHDLQEELESLYSEILPVAQMSAEQQYLEPALREIAARDGQGQERSIKAVKYIDDCLNFLVNRLQVFLERAEEKQCHKIALNTILAEANKELQPTDLPNAQSPSPTKSNTQRRRKSVTQRRGRRSSGLGEDDVEPERQLLRNLGITLPSDTHPSPSSRIEILERARADRSAKLGGHAESLQSTTESAISSHLLDANLTLQLLRDSLLVESKFKGVRLLGEEMEKVVEDLEREVDVVRESLETVDVQRLHGRNVHKEQLIERWAR